MPDWLFFGPNNSLAAVLAGIFGLMWGSFLNVVIHRMPVMIQRESDDYIAHESENENRQIALRMGSAMRSISYQSDQPLPHATRYNLSWPRSACPHCGHKITALENIPVLSYLVLRGKCSACKSPISARYPAIELLTGVLSAFLVWRFGGGLAGAGALVFAYLLIAMTFIDADTYMLPDDLTLLLLWCGLLININSVFAPSLKDAVVGAAAGYLTLWSVYWVFKFVTGKEGMGYGDFKLLGALGAWLGWTMLPLIVLLSSLVGALVGLSLIILKKHNRDKPIPFGPYLTAAGLIAFLWGKPITFAYLGLMA
jgi:leader peptidase (prepilin peptidase)/N-methyltransferase